MTTKTISTPTNSNFFVSLFSPVIFSNNVVLFSINFKPSYGFLTILNLTQEDFQCQVDGC